MAINEENLKKINDELEKLSDEELDDVAGGNWLDKIREKTRLIEYMNNQQNKNTARHNNK